MSNSKGHASSNRVVRQKEEIGMHAQTAAYVILYSKFSCEPTSKSELIRVTYLNNKVSVLTWSIRRCGPYPK